MDEEEYSGDFIITNNGNSSLPLYEGETLVTTIEPGGTCFGYVRTIEQALEFDGERIVITQI